MSMLGEQLIIPGRGCPMKRWKESSKKDDYETDGKGSRKEFSDIISAIIASFINVGHLLVRCILD